MTTKKTSCNPLNKFNNRALNLFLGLTKSSRLLAPYSKEFSKIFHYEILYIDSEIANAQNTIIKPDLSLNSNKIGNSLFFEFSHAEIDKKLNKKNLKGQNQLDRYSITDKEEFLSTILPKSSLTSIDFPFVVGDKHSKGYIEGFSNNTKYNFPLLKLEYIDNSYYKLQLIFNSFSNNAVNTFFSQEMKFNRIPDIITIDPSDLSSSAFTIFNKCTNYLIQFLNRLKLGDTFTANDLALKIFGADFFNNIFDAPTKKNILSIINSFISDLTKKFPLLSKNFFISTGVGTYKILIPDKNKEAEINKIYRKLHETTANIITPDMFQPKLFDDSEYYKI